MAKESKESVIFLCPGNCEICTLKSAECPERGSLNPKTGNVSNGIIGIFKKMQANLDNILLKKITPETIAKEYSEDLFRLIQFCEIEEEIGAPKVTIDKLKEEIMKLVLIFDGDGMDDVIKKKIDAAVATIAIKLMEIKQRACRDQGVACRVCYLQDACLQRLQQKNN